MSNKTTESWAARWEQLTPFQVARIKLTLWYFLGFALLVVFFTFLTFNAKQSAFFRVYTVVNTNSPNSPQVVELNNKLGEFNARFQQRVIIFDVVILIIATFVSYFLSGKTLEPIQKMMEEQNHFAADVSHSLRTPLTTIGLEIEAFMRASKPKSPTVKLLTSIKEEVLHMTHITQGLLTLVRTQNHQTAPTEKINLSELVTKTTDQMRPIIINHQQSITTKTQTKKQIIVNGNLDQIKQVIIILLENAIKYNKPKGKIAVSLKAQPQKAVIEITDSGLGIDKKEIPLITQRFYRASNQKTTKGTGLGLSIAQKIISSHNGSFAIKSKLGKGTSCTVFLPLARSTHS